MTDRRHGPWDRRAFITLPSGELDPCHRPERRQEKNANLREEWPELVETTKKALWDKGFQAYLNSIEFGLRAGLGHLK